MNEDIDFTYILSGNGYMATPIKTNLLLGEFEDYIRDRSEKIHKNSHDTIFKLGAIEFVNPKVNMVSDYTRCCPIIQLTPEYYE